MTESSKARRVLIAGGSGFLGTNLARALRGRGDGVLVLTRGAAREADGVRFMTWDGRTVGPWAEELPRVDAVVNIAGRTVDCVKTPDHVDEILRSRVESTRVLGEACARTGATPRVWVQMSTAHIYGDPPIGVTIDEDSAFGHGLAPDVGRAWEAAFEDAKPDDTRGVILRTSFVLGRDGGALKRLMTLARFGLGGTVGSGDQGISWIHERDMDRLFLRAIDDESMSGASIATAPNPVSNREFLRALRGAMKMPIGLPALAWMVRIGAPLIMRTDPELALYGRYCVSKRLESEGFEFEHPEIGPALRSLV
ncbi:MAG: TIGR01777 family oxidoreductase [Phycisphaerales bacterium]